MAPHKQPCVYILTSQRNNVLYIGVTSQLQQRVWQHKNNVVAGFTQKYQVHKLVYYEQYEEMDMAIAREKQLKNWKRVWKEELIDTLNPKRVDLYESL